jgi:hypothetical protein
MCKSFQTIIKNKLFEGLETSQLGLNCYDEEVSSTNYLKYPYLAWNKNLSGADSEQTKELDNICLVKPKYLYIKNYTSMSDSSDSEDIKPAESSQREVNISLFSKKLNSPRLIIYPEKLIKNKREKSSLGRISVKF